MKRPLATVLIACVLGVVWGVHSAWTFASCPNPLPLGCYGVSTGCPTLNEENVCVNIGGAYFLAPTGDLFIQYYTTPKTGGTSRAGLDQDNQNNICATPWEYLTLADCQNDKNGDQVTLKSAALCGGSSPCP
jgi:hypothetical protein